MSWRSRFVTWLRWVFTREVHIVVIVDPITSSAELDGKRVRRALEAARKAEDIN